LIEQEKQPLLGKETVGQCRLHQLGIGLLIKDADSFGANENGPTFANQKDPTRMAVGLTPAADDFI